MSKRGTGALADACVGIAAVMASFLTMYAIGVRISAGPSAAILSAVLALTLARRPRNAHTAPWLTLVMLPPIAVASALVGRLLESIPALGAALFVAAVFVSIWLRQFGKRAAGIGSLIALPFVVMLIVPVRPNAPGGPVVNLALVVGAGLIALAWTTIAHFVAERIGLARAERVELEPRAEARSATGGGLSVSLRMAMQMGVALTAAFALGFAFFPMHWGWVVLTAFVVCSGARGRGDAAYKGILRLGGALAGTILAAVLVHVALPSAAATASAIFAALFLAIWLRERNYAYWAACITLVLALLQDSQGEPAMTLLVGRLEGIFVGALCAVAATWFVFPIRTESVVRRGGAGGLAALDELFDDAPLSVEERARRLAIVERRIAEMDRAAPPVELHRRVFARSVEEHPAAWIGLVREFVPHVRERVRAGVYDDRATARRAIRHSRRSIGRRLTPQELEQLGDAPVTASLRRLRTTLSSS